jgi:hypothetical protein
VASTPRLGRCGGGTAESGADYERATDPWVAFAANGTVFQLALVFDATSPRSAVVASRSSDGGQSVYFLGDYQGLVAVGNGFVPVFAAATPDGDDRTDVFVRPASRARE